MITLTLLHPVQSTPVQSWTFKDSSIIRIGRALENDVILYSAVVSRFHVELRRKGGVWELINIGTNGTYLDGIRVQQVPLVEGSVIRLARSGPNIKIEFNASSPAQPLTEAVNLSNPSLTTPESEDLLEGHQALPQVPTKIPAGEQSEALKARETSPAEVKLEVVSAEHQLDSQPSVGKETLSSAIEDEDESPVAELEEAGECEHQRSQEMGLPFCINCGLPLKVWKTIGDYQVVKLIGSGGNTYMAWREGTSVILKTLKLEYLDNSEAVDLFGQQVKTLCQLNHPGLPKFYEGFEINSQPYLVCEMVHGQNLRQWVSSQGPLSQNQAIAWMLEVCQTLEYLHQQTPAVIHQGIRPGNLIRRNIPQQNQVIALVDLGDINLPTPDSPIYNKSIGYAAPEQQEGRVSPASDLYALGTTLIYLLTGQQPSSLFCWDNQELHPDMTHLSHLKSEIVEIVQKLTLYHPQDRYASVADLTAALRQLG